LLINNAGVLKRTPFLEISEEEWDWTLNTNLKGYFQVGQAVAKKMVARKIQGGMVNVSSAGQIVAAPNLTHYCVAKAGIEMLTKQMALELAPHKIRVNAIAPGLIETDLNRADIADPAFRQRRMARIPLEVIGVPEDVVGSVVFLANDQESRLITGASVFIDAGQTIWGA
jgi:NAD(P)-dependent dehydrogenase (short-subunit alcohol dehydrogenase family)